MDNLSEDSKFLFLLEDIGLTEEQKKILSDRLELMMNKYIRIVGRAKETSQPYFDGVIDGLNNAYKMINNISDDYLINDNI